MHKATILVQQGHNGPQYVQNVCFKSYFNPDYSVKVCVFLLGYIHLVFLGLDYSLVHMCLFVVVDLIIFLACNHMDWIFVYY